MIHIARPVAVVSMLAAVAAAAREPAPPAQPVCRTCQSTRPHGGSPPALDPEAITTIEDGIVDVRRPERARGARGAPPWERVAPRDPKRAR